jgi:hypothetical protein
MPNRSQPAPAAPTLQPDAAGTPAPPLHRQKKFVHNPPAKKTCTINWCSFGSRNLLKVILKAELPIF